MIYFHWIYLLLYVVITVPAIITVLMDNRQPAKTMAWILVFFFIPFVGIIFYFFFGQDNRKQRIISRRLSATAAWTSSPSAPCSSL